MLDPPRDDSKDTIQQAKEHGLRVKMVTGDDVAIGNQISGQLGMGSRICIAAGGLFTKEMNMERLSAGADRPSAWRRQTGLAGCSPSTNTASSRRLQDREHIVAMTGDGRQRCAGTEAGRLRGGGKRRHGRRPRRGRPDSHRPRPVDDHRCHRRGAEDLRADHQLYHVTGWR